VSPSTCSACAALTVAVDHLPELRGLRADDACVEIGAALSLTEVETRLAGRVPLLDELLPQFASRLIRNRATIGGNLGTGSPIGDLAPVLLALDTAVVLVSERGERELPLAEYFTGYRTSVRAADELIRVVRIPLPLATTTSFQKVAKRRYDDISSVAVALALDITDGVVRSARVGLGGVAAVPLRARATEDALTGRPWDHETVEQAAHLLSAEGSPIDDHRASAAYRAAMLGQALRRLLAQTTAEQVHR
jgi:xanthine dehydrogenase small subunit